MNWLTILQMIETALLKAAADPQLRTAVFAAVFAALHAMLPTSTEKEVIDTVQAVLAKLLNVTA